MAKKKLVKEKIVQPVLQKKQEIQELIQPKKSRSWKYVLAVVLVIPLLAVGGMFGYRQIYQGKIYPGVYLGEYSVTGLSQSEFESYIAQFERQVGDKGLLLQVVGVDGKTQNVSVAVPLNGSTSSLYTKLYLYGRQGTLVEQLVSPWKLFVSPQQTPIPYTLDHEVVKKNLQTLLAPFEDQPHNASIDITQATPLTYSVVPEKSGRLFNTEEIIKNIESKIRKFDTTILPVRLQNFAPTIVAVDAEKMTNKVQDFLNTGDIVLSYAEESTHFKKQWRITKTMYAPWVELVRTTEGELIFGFDKDKVTNFITKEVSPYIDRAPENAVFKMEGEKVIEFKASKIGQGADIEKMLTDIHRVLADRTRGDISTSTIAVVIKTIDPIVKTADVNNLGITDVVGVGISTFKDSHNNRIRNIANAVKRLNGTLIKPGEIFSANKAAGPYTLANGFLPEAVIKGTEIKNEVGGGMCQIGTTLFRMAMNSGMDITERRNHSLVVSYYADPVNGNPGTDATLYEPILDLKFLNDTGNYLLLQTDIDYKRQQLTFTLWGKPDGRSGSYTHPVVHRWLGVGAPQEVMVDTLPPGKKKCQSAFPGAVASFTYTRTTPSGEKIDRVFESYYRPLPRICMVGKTETPTCPEGQVCSQPLDTSGGTPTSPVVDVVAPIDAPPVP